MAFPTFYVFLIFIIDFFSIFRNERELQILKDGDVAKELYTSPYTDLSGTDLPETDLSGTDLEKIRLPYYDEPYNVKLNELLADKTLPTVIEEHEEP